MRSYVVSTRDDGMRISRYVQKIASGITESGLYKAFRTKAVKLNGKRCEPSDKVSAGDCVELYLPDNCFPAVDSRPDFMSAGKEVTVLYEDANIALLFKPANLNSHPVKGEYSDNLISRFLRYLYEKNEFSPSDGVFTPALCNRLDRNTAGIVIAGKTREAVNEINRLIREDKLEKHYRAVCVKTPPEDGIYEAWHYKREDNVALISDKEKDGYKQIKTGFRLLRNRDDISLLDVTLYTGRSHQIRAHLAHLGCPILGDPKYGYRKINAKYHVKAQCLTAYSIRFSVNKGSLLSYLDGMEVSLHEEPFLDLFK